MAGRNHPVADMVGCLRRRPGQLHRARPRHCHEQVETVEQRAGELVSVGGEPLSRAPALGRRIPACSAGTKVHRRHELKPRRKDRLPLDPGDADHAVLERLAQSLERRAWELRELVEKEDAAMREARLTGARP